VVFALSPLVGLNLWRRNRRRTILTILAVLAAAVVSAVVMVVPFAMNSIVSRADGVPRLAVTNRSSLGRWLPESYYANVARLPGVVADNRMTRFGGVYDDARISSGGVGIDADNPDLVGGQVVAVTIGITAGILPMIGMTGLSAVRECAG
jgi:hypothetical protein